MRLISTVNTIELVGNDEILCIEACQNYSKFYLTNKRMILSRDSLAHLEKSMPSFFFRIHHSYIINIHMVSRYYRNGEVELASDAKYPVARRRRTEFVDAMERVFASNMDLTATN